MFHSLIITLAIIGLPHIFKDKINSDSMEIELAEPDLIKNDMAEKDTNTKILEQKIYEKQKELQQEIITTENQILEEQKEIITQAIKPALEQTKPVAKIIPPILIKKPEPPERPLKIKKEEKLKKDLAFNDMLKDLSKQKLINNTIKEKKNNTFNETISNLANSKFEEKNIIAEPGEISKIQKLIYEQVDSKWSRPPGLKINKNTSLKIIISLNRIGQLESIKIDQEVIRKAKEDNSLRPFIESAIRAVKRASPFQGLNKNRYSIWKIIIINFKPLESIN